MLFTVLYGFLMGFIVALALSIVIDGYKERKDDEWFKQMEEALTGSDFCEVGCGYYEEYFVKYTDKNIAMDELYHNRCYNCPVRMGIELLEKRKEG